MLSVWMLSAGESFGRAERAGSAAYARNNASSLERRRTSMSGSWSGELPEAAPAVEDPRLPDHRSTKIARVPTTLAVVKTRRPASTSRSEPRRRP